MQWKKALDMLAEMRAEGVAVNSFVYCSAIDACAKVRLDYWQGSGVKVVSQQWYLYHSCTTVLISIVVTAVVLSLIHI